MTEIAEQQALDPSTRVGLRVDGHQWGGWESVDITASLEEQSRSFTLGIARYAPGGTEQVPIAHGARAEVTIGDDLVLTGWVNATPRAHDPHSTAFGIAGRGLCGDLVDCAALNKPPQFKSKSTRAIVTALAAPYGVAVRSEIGEGETVPDHTIQPGETVFESIGRLLKISRLLSTENAAGELVLAGVGSAGRAHDDLMVGRNVQAGDCSLDFSECFSEYRVLAQHAPSASRNGAAANEVQGSAPDSRVARKRVLVITESGNVTAKQARERAEWERAHRMSRALTANYQVAGWRQSNGALWQVNQIVHVVDPIIGFDRDMLIVACNYRLDDSGMVTRLTVAPPDGYYPEPPDPEKRKGKRRKKGDHFEYLVPSDWKPET